MGFEGQSRIAAACVVIAGADVACEIAARSLAAAGVGKLRLMCEGTMLRPLRFAGALTASNPELQLEFAAEWPGEKSPAETEPTDDVAWGERLAGAKAVIVHSGSAGPSVAAMLRAAARGNVPVVAIVSRADGIEVLSFGGQGPEPCAHADPDRAVGEGARISGSAGTQPPTSPSHDAEAVVAGHLAAAEILIVLCEAGTSRSHARALHLPSGGVPRAASPTWTPGCIACGDTGKEMSTA